MALLHDSSYNIIELNDIINNKNWDSNHTIITAICGGYEGDGGYYYNVDTVMEMGQVER
ncbi:MAG: hypothetical protein H5T44_04740 [Thermoplasmatales archaeon]|nr:hypothetical protein [Thermoplasmatales archaeon]